MEEYKFGDVMSVREEHAGIFMAAKECFEAISKLHQIEMVGAVKASVVPKEPPRMEHVTTWFWTSGECRLLEPEDMKDDKVAGPVGRLLYWYGGVISELGFRYRITTPSSLTFCRSGLNFFIGNFATKQRIKNPKKFTRHEIAPFIRPVFDAESSHNMIEWVNNIWKDIGALHGLEN